MFGLTVGNSNILLVSSSWDPINTTIKLEKYMGVSGTSRLGTSRYSRYIIGIHPPGSLCSD